jgi:hypothetical protein
MDMIPVSMDVGKPDTIEVTTEVMGRTLASSRVVVSKEHIGRTVKKWRSLPLDGRGSIGGLLGNEVGTDV